MAAVSTHGVTGNMSFRAEDAGAPVSPHRIGDESILRSSHALDSLDADKPRVSNPHRPSPLPTFVFPMKTATAASSSSPRSAPASFSRASGRRPVSAVELNEPNERRSADLDRPRLPEFAFGPQLQSPPLSPRDIPSRPGFHKRSTSEFIGGDGKNGRGAGLMSTSPTKGDNVLPPPNPAAFGPPAGRRGHAHRRSAAISCHDLSMILKPDPTVSKGGVSAPTSPAADDYDALPFSGPLDLVGPKANLENESGANSPTTRPLNRNRVGFSDFVDIIPRPLSLVSSDSASTVRQGHSVTGSMSSIISAGTASPQSKEKRGLAPTSNARMIDERPRTAEPVTDSTQFPEAPRRRNSIPLLIEAAMAPSSLPSTPKSAKKWGFFGHEPPISGESSPKSRPTSATSSEKTPKPAPAPAEVTPSIPDAASPDVLLESIEPTTSRRSSVSRKPSKKQKKVRSWAGSILSRKSRQRPHKQKLNRRSPTPPLRAYIEEQQAFVFTESHFEDEQASPPLPELQTDIASWKPRKLPPQEEYTSPIIDLDAALGPFNTPSGSRFGDDWEQSQRNGTKKRTMHSASGTYYHRRAESAPEFENPRFGLHRLGSSSSMGMEDVFEEENEDEEWEDAKASDRGSITKTADEDEDAPGFGIDIKVVDSEGMEADKSMDFEDTSFQRGVKRKGSGLSEGERRNISSTKSVHSNRSVIDEPIMEESSPVEIVDDSIPPRSDSGSRSSDSTATPPLRPAAKNLAPVDIHTFTFQPTYPTPTSPRSATQSSYPSPRSPFSYDTQRISTAPSSLTDEQGFQSLLLGEPGPEVRMSVDDVPSLSSSNSTMTRESGIPMASNGPQFRDGQRSSSMSAAAISRKRSSMASLSRLISSSHGEKSKLSIETRPSTSEGIEKKDKASRGKRISRLMQFWKPKDS